MIYTLSLYILFLVKKSLHTLIMLKENKRHSISPRWGDQVRHQRDPLSTVSFPESLLRRVHGGALHGWFMTLVGAQTQTDWEWVEQSLSFSCLGKPCHHFRCVGGVSGCCSILPFPDSDICQIFPITPPLRSSTGTWRSVVVTGRGDDCWGFKGRQLLVKNMFYANSHEVTPADTDTGSHGADGRMAHDNFHIHVCHSQDWISAAERHLLRMSLDAFRGGHVNHICVKSQKWPHLHKF